MVKIKSYVAEINVIFSILLLSIIVSTTIWFFYGKPDVISLLFYLFILFTVYTFKLMVCHCTSTVLSTPLLRDC